MEKIKEAFSWVFWIVIVPALFITFMVFVDRQEVNHKRTETEKCTSEGKIFDGYCKTKYEYCLGKVRDTFEDLTDTVGVSQNNQDSVSQSMRAEIDRCLSLN